MRTGTDLLLLQVLSDGAMGILQVVVVTYV